jgi:hypothetical protein
MAAARPPVDHGAEDPGIRGRYGSGWRRLLARRLVDAGVDFVTKQPRPGS